LAFGVDDIYRRGLFDIKVNLQKCPSIYFSSIVKSRSNPFMEPSITNNKGKIACSMKQQWPLMGLEPTTPSRPLIVRVRDLVHTHFLCMR